MTPEEYADRVVADYVTTRGESLRERIADAVREAVAAERERCAKAAEEFSSLPGDPSWQHCETGQQESCVAIAVAARIREGS